MKFQEKILIENAKKGDVQSFEKLILPYRKKMLNFAYRFLGNREDAKDVVQEVFLKAFKKVLIQRKISLTGFTRLTQIFV